MANVFEPRPKGHPAGAHIDDYVVEDHADHVLVIWNPSSPHYRRALGASKGERLWRMQGGEADRLRRWC